MPPSYWVEALATATYVLNRRPCSAIGNAIPYEGLFGHSPDYSILRVFGCLCYPNLTSTTPHKLAPRSTTCVFLGYPSSHKGYRCLDLSSRRIIISCHVVFDEFVFSFEQTNTTPPASAFDFLLQDTTSVAPPSGVEQPQVTSTLDDPAILLQGPVVPSGTPPSAAPIQAGVPAAAAADPVATAAATRAGASPVAVSSQAGAAAASSWALIDNNTWRLVPRPPGANVVTGKWIFKHKFHSDGTHARHKARWVVRGFSQQHGIDYDETFSPVVKPATIRVVLSIAVSRDWPIHQLDVKNAFLHGHLEETVYCQQPPGFVDPATPNHVCQLQKSLYGLKQALRAWYQRFASYIRSVGFVASASDTSLFVYTKGGDLAYLLLYVDDIILTASSSALLQRVTTLLHSEFAMTDLGNLHHFLGISVT
ncbi:hypothetical protein U9M48_002973 [Paspalum notatum var. saurae]|uniref:Reverse transcriptase Ty1/copia-type domain-containing protein n=1 Tax=Paspalum notatum var. saurae TaxID=547442 RepID=A0AAQ3SHV3_PASNO